MATPARNSALLSLVTVVGLSALALSSTASAAPISFESAVLADLPIAYWRFGETDTTTAMDSSGNGHHGTYTGGVTLGQPGIGGGDTAALFDGKSGRVTVPDDAGISPDHITMEALVRWDGPNAFQQRILEKSWDDAETFTSYGLNVLPDGKVLVELETSGGDDSHYTTLAALTVGESAHIVATFDGSTVLVYINGVLQVTDAGTGTLPASGVILYDFSSLEALGLGNQAERGRPFNGLIDEIALYDYALSADRVRDHAGIVPEPATVSLVGAGLIGLAAVLRRRGSRRP